MNTPAACLTTGASICSSCLNPEARVARPSALDQGGVQMSSLELSRYLQRALNQSRDLLFVVGGDEGLGAEVLDAAHLTLSLSRFTLPHRLARLVLVEQIYRAFTMLRGEPYAK